MKRDALMARDVAQVKVIESYGVDLDRKRAVDVNFWAPDEDSCKAFVEACKRNEMPSHTVLGPVSPEGDQRWLIRCSIAASVTFMVAQENVETSLLFADKFDCEYDGWGTAIVEAAGSASPKQ